MAKSHEKTTVAALRKIIGIKVKEFTEIIGKSESTITSLESGRLKLSEETAQIIALETGVSLHWLLDGDASKQPTADSAIYGEGGRAYTQESYELTRARRQNKAGDRWQGRPRTLRIRATEAMNEMEHIVADLAASLFYAAIKGKEDLAIYKLNKFAKQFDLEFRHAVSEANVEFSRKTRELITAKTLAQKKSDAAFLKTCLKILIGSETALESRESIITRNTFEEKLKYLYGKNMALRERVPTIDTRERAVKPKVEKSPQRQI